jgi:predicted nucleotidyltransferase
MQERSLGEPGTPKKTEVFYQPNPYDLLVLTATFDDREIIAPPKTYFPASNPEQQLESVTIDLKEAFGEHLLFVGLTGSRADHADREDRDLDVIAIVDDSAVADRVLFEGDLKIISHTGLREYIECGYSLIASQFRKAQPLFEKEGITLDELRALKAIPEKAIPFMVTKSKFSEQTADIFRLMSSKYRSIFLHQHGFQSEAFSQLKGAGSDDLFKLLQEDLDSVSSSIYAMLARYYTNLGLNRMYHSLSEMTHALYIKEMGDVADIDEVVEWALKRTREPGALLRHIYDKRVACYKNGEMLLDTEFDTMREGIREQNRVLEAIILSS